MTRTRRRRTRHTLTCTFIVAFEHCLCGGLVRWSMRCDDRVAYETLRYRTDRSGD